MKKRIWICVLIAVFSFFSLVAALNLTDRATAVSGDISAECSFKDSWRFRMALLPDEISFFAGFACPFSQNFSVKIGGLTYCLATDDCDSVYIPELKLYYSISQPDHEIIHNLFSEYELPQQ